MELKSYTFRLRRAPRVLLGCFLSLVLFVSVSLSANHAFHQFVHEDGGCQSHLCLICSIAKGQICAAEVVLVATILLCFFWTKVSGAPPAPRTGFDYRLSPSRAPPSR